jgi:Tfp pilus assembly PilM family ATPase
MPFGFLKSASPPPIGVDFGVARLKVLQATPPGEQSDLPTLIGQASRDVPAELWNKPVERLEWQAAALAEMLRAGSFKGKRVACAISSAHCFAQHVQVPKDGNKNIADIIGEELRGVTGREPATLITRHFEVGEVSRGGHKKSEVVCFAMPREAVVAHMRALKACKLDPVGVHSEHMALVRSMDRLHKQDSPASATLIVDLGSSSTKVVVSHGRDLVVAKTIGVGGRQISAGAAPTPAPRAASTSSDGGLALAEAPPAADTVNSELSILADEIAQCVRYHQALFPDRKIERLVFVGGEALRTETCRAIARGVRVPAQMADPLASLPREAGYRCEGDAVKSVGPGWAVALGLCVLPTDL